jgi:3-oxoacyl-[acyl-carrier protein] reductase
MSRRIDGTADPSERSVRRQTRSRGFGRLTGMTTLLNDKVALVTGGGRGIGAACAQRLAEDIAAKIRSTGRRAVVARTAAQFGRLDILVNNAAVFEVASPTEFDVAAFDRMVAVNVRAPFVAARAAVGHMGATPQRMAHRARP